MDKNNTLGGFEAVFDSFIPKTDDENKINDIQDTLDDDELENLKNNSTDPVLDKMKKDKNIPDKKGEPSDKKDDEPDVEPVDDTKPNKDDIEKNIEPEPNVDENESEVVKGFFGAMAEKLGWEIEEGEETPKDVESLINYFQDVIEESSKPEYASEEMEKLDNFVKQGGDLRKYLTIDAEIDLENIDMDDESNQKAVVRELLKEKGFSSKQIEKKLSKYEDAGLLEDEAEDAIEDLKEIREEKKEQLLAIQKKQYEAYQAQQQQFYTNVVDEIKGLKNIRGIAIPEKDKKVLIDYILKPDTDGKTKYQKDYAKGGVKNLIESAYFTMNADKLIEAAKKEGNNSAIDKFKRSLRSTSVSSKSKQAPRGSSNDTIWDSFTKKLRIS